MVELRRTEGWVASKESCPGLTAHLVLLSLFRCVLACCRRSTVHVRLFLHASLNDVILPGSCSELWDVGVVVEYRSIPDAWDPVVRWSADC